MSAPPICSVAGCPRRSVGVVYVDFYVEGEKVSPFSVLLNCPLCHGHQRAHVMSIFQADELALLAVKMQSMFPSHQIEIERTKLTPAGFDDPNLAHVQGRPSAGRVFH